MPDGDWDALLRQQDGVFTRRQALRYVSAKVLERRIATGRWQAIHRGVYAAHNGPASPPQRLWAAVLAASAGGPALLGGLTALAQHGLQRLDSPLIEVLVPPARRSRRSPDGVRIHRTTWMPASDIGRTSPPATTTARSLVDAASWARSERQARTIVAMSFQQRLVSAEEVGAVLAKMTVVPRRGLIARTVADAAAGAHSLGELDLVALCRREKLPMPSLQQRRAGRFLDAVWQEWGVWAEIDGAHHMDADRWWADMARHNQLARRDEVLLRFPAWLLRDRPAEVAATIRQALREAGWQ
jgi:very-short-patch-repair endonuclease